VRLYTSLVFARDEVEMCNDSYGSYYSGGSDTGMIVASVILTGGGICLMAFVAKKRKSTTTTSTKSTSTTVVLGLKKTLNRDATEIASLILPHHTNVI